jgi:hypothetical protein
MHSIPREEIILPLWKVECRCKDSNNLAIPKWFWHVRGRQCLSAYDGSRDLDKEVRTEEARIEGDVCQDARHT